jgi:hypothetical protein
MVYWWLCEALRGFDEGKARRVWDGCGDGGLLKLLFTLDDIARYFMIDTSDVR